MSTPPNKNEQRRQERLANIAKAQSERRATSDDAASESAAETAADGVSPSGKTTTGQVKATTRSGNATGSRVNGTSNGTSKNPSRPVSATSRAAGTTPGTTKTPTRPSGGTGTRPVGQTKTPTRPATGASANIKSATTDDDDDDLSTGTGTKREARREARRVEIERVRLERKRQLQAKKRKELLVRTAVIGIPAVIIALLIFLIIQTSLPQKAKPFAIATKSMPAAGWASTIQCQGSEQLTQHIHANMQIYFNGKNEPIPAGVGIETDNSGNATSFCWLHTHQPDGAIHIESPNTSDKYTVGDFLAIWDKQEFQGRWLPEGAPTITSNSFFGKPLDATNKLTVYVQGKVWTGDIHTLVLQSGENIWLEYGTPLVTPKGFDFAANGLVP
ncbi:MAG TPA: hypothetical protein VKB76_16030 [Ktedonobacterales bacterium]|nr:hypothetical protein [Ktedonobacterales bacterium]